MTRKVVSPIALDKSINTTEQTPRNIADVLAQQLAAIKTAIESGNGNLEAAFVCYYGVTTATQIKDAIEDGNVPYFYYNGAVAQLWKVETDKYTFRTTNTRSVEGQTILDVVDYVVNGSVWSTITREVSGGSSSGQSYIASVNSLADFDTTGHSGMHSVLSVNNVPADGIYQLSVMLHITPKTASATKSDLVFHFTSGDGTGWPNHTFHAVVDDSQTFAQQLSFSTSVSLKAGQNTLRIQCGGLNTEYLVFVDELTLAQLVNGVYHNGDDFDEVHTLPEAADFNNDDGVLVDGATGGPRFMLWRTLANKVLGFIKSLPTTITAFRTGDVIPVDGPSGTAKMSKNDLLAETAENSLSAICERYDSTKQYDAGAVFYVGNTIYQAKHNTANINELYIEAYADPVPLDELIGAIFNRDKNVITLFANVGLFILSDGTEDSNSAMATTDYISVEGMTSLFVRTHFGNQWGGGVVCYDGEKNFVGSIHDDGDGGYADSGTVMERIFAPADLPAGTQYVRVCRVITQPNYSYVVVNGVEGGVVADKIGFDKVADKFTNTKNYVQGQIISDKGEVAVCNSHLFGGDIDWSKFDKISLGALVEKIFANGYKLVEDFPYRDKFINSTGAEDSANFFEVTQYTSLTGVYGIVALGNFGNQYGGGLAFYDKDFNYISSIYDDGTGAYPSVNNQIIRTFTSSDFPANAVYVRLTNRYGVGYKKPYMYLFGSAMRGGEVARREMVNVDRCCKWLANHVASLTTNGVLSIPKSPNTKNNYTISASAEFSTFGRISLYHGTSAYTLGHIEIDDTNLYEYNYTNGNLLSTTPHGLTMSGYVNITLSVGQLFGAKAHLVLATGTQKYIKDVEWSGCRDDIKLKSVSGTYTNCSVKLSGAGYRMDTWVFGDSYCDMWPDKLLDLKSDARFMIDSYSGRASFDAYWSLISDLRLGYKPKRIVWAMGMNNADSGAVNADWKTIFDRVKALCEKMGIDFIPCTIPCTPTIDNSYKNAYVASNCTEYIDVAGCVGATAQGSTWFAGLLASDNVHPSTVGQYVIANEMIGYLGV